MEDVLELLADARRNGKPCALATVAEAKGSVPRQAGAKMLVYADGSIAGTVGGGKFESLVITGALECLSQRRPLLKTWPLHEEHPDSFGAICGGEVTVLIEPFAPERSLFLVGGGHCAQAVAALAAQCGFHVTVTDDRTDILAQCTAAHVVLPGSAPEHISRREWTARDAVVIVSRHYDIDREALAATLRRGGPGYVGMIGSRRKVRRVFDQLASEGFAADQLASVHAPIGLDLGAESPAEIAVSVIAEILMVFHGTSGKPLKL